MSNEESELANTEEPSTDIFFTIPDLVEALEDPRYELDILTAASVGDLDYVLCLLNKTNSSNLAKSSNVEGWTGVMYAAYYDHPKVLQCMIDASLEDKSMMCDFPEPGIPDIIKMESNLGRTALTMAAMCGNDVSLRILIKNLGATATSLLDKPDHLGRSALFNAVLHGHWSSTEILLEAGANANAVETKGKGYSALMVACQEGHGNVAQVLVHHGAQINFSNVLGENARSICKKFGHDRILTFLNKAVRAQQPSVLDGPKILAQKLAEKKKMEEGGEKQSESVDSFLGELGLEKYSANFRDRKLTKIGEVLNLTDGELKDMGITLLGPRRKITSALAKLKANLTEEKLIIEDL